MAEDSLQPPGEDTDLHFTLNKLEKEKVSLVRKVSDLQSVIQEKEREIQSQKVGKDGMDTVAKLLQETSKDLALAEKKNRVLDIGMRNLQNRLEQNGLNSSIELEEQELYIPGPSKQVMDNLVKENARLRLLSNSNLDFDEIHSLKVRIQEQEDTIERLERENDELMESLSERSGARPAGNRIKQVNYAQRMEIDKKDEQIRRLEQERQQQAEEIEHLQQQLNIIQATPTIVSEMNVDESEDIQRLREDYENLSQKCKELMEMNLRWKSYDSQREGYVKQLRGELDTARKSPLQAETQQQMQALLLASRQQLEKTLAEKATLEGEVSRLDAELGTLQEAFSAQGEKLRQTTQNLEQLRVQGTPDKQHVDALHLQIQMCTEDFENERKDREKAQGRLTRVEQENQALIKEVKRLQQSLQQFASRPATVRPQFQSMNIPTQPAARPNFPVDQHRLPGAYNMEPEVRLNARGIRRRSRELSADEMDSSGWVEVDGLSARSGPGRGVSGQPRGTSPRSTTLLEEITMLQCPKCKKEYKPNQHEELLEHIEICC